MKTTKGGHDASDARSDKGFTTVEGCANYLDSATPSLKVSSKDRRHIRPSTDKSLLVDLRYALLLGEDEHGHLTDAVSAIFVTDEQCANGLVAGVLLQRVDRAWHVRPYYLDESSDFADSVLLGTGWLNQLVSLSKSVLQPYIDLTRGLKETIRAGVVREIQTRILYHDRGAFFDSAPRAMEWAIAAEWPKWDEMKIDQSQRYAAFCRLYPDKLSLEEFLSRCPDHECRSIGGPKKKLGVSVAGSKVEPATLNPVSIAHSESHWKPEPGKWFDRLVRQDADFSAGGPPQWQFKFGSNIARRMPERERIQNREKCKEQLWWWHDFTLRTWSEDNILIFQDNFERSAFFYELRARLDSRRDWHPFGKPWVRLNNTQRGALVSIWPPLHVGRFLLGRDLHPAVVSHMPSIVPIQVNLNMPIEDMLAKVKEIAKTENLKRGVRQNGPASSRRKWSVQKWELLEWLDENYYLGTVLKSAQRSTKTKVVGEYNMACDEAGIEP